MNFKHGHARTNNRSATYRSWMAMWQRCTQLTDVAYDRYGGNGITVCDRWKSFDLFLADMGERPKETSLDRKNNQGNYEPSNCKWSNRPEQQRNRNYGLISAFGRTQTVIAWAEEFDTTQSRIQNRLKMGWMPEAAISAPARTYQRKATL